MIKFFNKFKDWKKNIKYVQVFEINIVFNDSTIFDKLERELSKFYSIAEELKILTGQYNKKFIQEDTYITERHKTKQLYLESKDLIPGSIFHGVLQISSYINDKRDIDNSTVRCISKLYPEVLLQYVLSEFHSSINYITLSNPTLSSWDYRTSLTSYKYRKGIRISHDSFPPYPKKVDVSNRPGRNGQIGKCNFRGANEYWFGKSYFNCVGKERILAFKDADRIETLENEIVHIKLFDEENYWDDFAQDKLASFRYHLGVKDIEKRHTASNTKKS